MPVLDFKEIPQANVADGQQDIFELFARDFFKMLGFEIVEGPDRGQDGGRDLIVVENRDGIIGKTQFKWLVSCKHKIHSGQSVIDSDETDITDRVKAHGTSGFIGFYSTIISSGLSRKIRGLGIEHNVFDREKIEAMLLENELGGKLAKRYFPISYLKWEASNHKPANLFEEYEPLNCVCCGKDLLESRSGIIAFVTDLSSEPHKYVDVYWACKGKCDRYIEQTYNRKEYITGWEDISDILIPGKFIEWNIAHMNRLRKNQDDWKDVAFEKLKDFIIKVSQLVIRNQTEEQIKRWIRLASLPRL